MTERITVAFEGEGCGVDELSWGQRDIWMTMVRQRSWLPMGGIKPLPAGTTVEDVADELRYLMSRYQSMRTRLRFDIAGRPTQVVSSSGEIELEIVDIAAADPRETAEAVGARYHHAAYDFAQEWPVRMAVVRHRGVPTHLVVIMCHLVTDGLGAMVMLDEVRARPTAPVSGMQPLAQARWQRSPAGRRHNDAALRYWEGMLRAIPPRQLPGSADKREPRHLVGVLQSPALYVATQAITARTGVEAASVLLTAYAVALARLTGVNPVAARPMVGNRFRPGLADVFCMVAQHGLCVLDVADMPFDEALDRTRRASMTAYKYAYYDPAEMAELIARIAQEQGPSFDVTCLFNDRRSSARPEPPGAPTPEHVREALTRTAFEWTAAQDEPFEPLMVHIDEVPDALQLHVFLDSHFMSPADAEALLRGMQEVAVEAALDPRARTRVLAGV